MRENDLLNRTFNFGVNTLKFLRFLPDSFEYRIIKNQLGKSSTSVGANYEESQAGISKSDFKNKIKISLKEAREANYWYRILSEIIEEPKPKELESLMNESLEIKNIFAKILNNLKD
jgi:four helix bundle protein